MSLQERPVSVFRRLVFMLLSTSCLRTTALIGSSKRSPDRAAGHAHVGDTTRRRRRKILLAPSSRHTVTGFDGYADARSQSTGELNIKRHRGIAQPGSCRRLFNSSVLARLWIRFAFLSVSRVCPGDPVSTCVCPGCRLLDRLRFLRCSWDPTLGWDRMPHTGPRRLTSVWVQFPMT